MVDDKVILQRTVQEQDNGKVMLKYDLPSGETLKSEWMPADKLKGAVLIVWCTLVRDTMKAEEEAEAAEKAPTPSETPTPAEAAKAPTEALDGPEGYIADQLMRAEFEADSADEALAAAQERRDTAWENLHKWEAVADSLGLLTDKGDVDDVLDSETKNDSE